MNTYKYLNQFRKQGADPQLITKVINEHKADKEKRILFYERYKASVEGVPILKREAVDYDEFETGAIKRIDNKVNNRLNNAFDAEIVDTKVGYMFGHPIGYEIEEKSRDSLVKMKDEVNDFRLRNNVEDKDSEWGKKAAICGYSARMAYIDKEGKERIVNIDPWETIIISSTDYTEPEFAIRYFDIDDNKQRVEFYNNAYFYVFETGENGLPLVGEGKLHTFDYCPLWGLPNNEELMADAEKVFALIDAYDRTLSDASNEIEQYRLAYLILKGLGADAETIADIKKSGVFELFEKDDDVRYLTKDINDTMIENHLDRLEANILRLAKSVNFSDESFSNNASGVAMKYKLMSLENKCVTMERKMTAALRYQFKVICSAWAKKGICSNEDYLKLWFSFRRNVPANLLEEAQTATTLMAITSQKTALSTLSIVDDVDYEMEQRELERDGIEPLFKDDGGDEDGSRKVQ
ncbi:phage portal protein [Lysinibacillus sp. CD3-6]|uniref:phage portal protein n=1 Tax=Lysinibacillus sp. CD3-6 TaxID=2892541 RepID=UPI0011697B22|nr:phage portal protein [Lysinibacillus sp. CD3-6]UED81071.1 phage portal protein [Lysinibacillus sp. CD3-6]